MSRMARISISTARNQFFFLAILLLLTLMVYWQTLGFDFLSNWDDNRYVTGNPDIKRFDFINFVRIFSSYYVGNYAPLHLFSYMLDYQVAGLSPAWFHGVNLMLHLANGVLFYLFVSRLTGKSDWAFTATALFLLHPVQVESVAWISQRKNVLSMLFSLSSFLAYISYRRNSDDKIRNYILSVSFLFCALLTKSVAVIMPGYFLLYDLCLESSVSRKLILIDKIPYVIMVVLTSVVTVISQASAGATADLFNGVLYTKALTMLTVLMRYLGLIIWPVNLSVLYSFDAKSVIDGTVLLALGIVVVVSIYGTYLALRDRVLFFGFGMFFIGLIPVSQIIPLVTLMNDRYLYFPMLGIAWLAGGYVSRLNDRFPMGKLMPVWLLISAVLVSCIWLSFQRTQVWQNSIVLWGNTARQYPDAKDMLAAIAEVYLKAGQNSEALAAYEELFKRKGSFNYSLGEEKALNEAANLYINSGQMEKALPLIVELTSKYPQVVSGHIKLGYYHYVKGHTPEAEAAYRTALRIQPDSVKALVSLAILCQETGRLAEARTLYGKAVAAGGNGPDLQYNLACVEARSGHAEESLVHLEMALRLGYRNIDSVFTGPEFAAVRRLPSFSRLIGSSGQPGR